MDYLFEAKAVLNKVKHAVLNLTPMESKVMDATNGDKWGASSTLMQEIAKGTYHFQEFNEIMNILTKRLTERDPTRWRQIYKALTLLEYLVKNGSEKVVDFARGHVTMIKMLKKFHFIDEQGKDQGLNVKNRSKELVELLASTDRIKDERKKAKANKSKYIGIESKSQGFGGFSGSSGGSNGFGSRAGGFGSNDDMVNSSRFDSNPSPPSRFNESSPPTTSKDHSYPKQLPKDPPVEDLFSFDDPLPQEKISAQPNINDEWSDFNSVTNKVDDEFGDFQSVSKSPIPSTSTLPSNPPKVASNDMDLLGGLGDLDFGVPITTSLSATTPSTQPKPTVVDIKPSNDIWSSHQNLFSLDQLHQPKHTKSNSVGKISMNQLSNNFNSLQLNSNWNQPANGSWNQPTNNIQQKQQQQANLSINDLKEFDSLI